MHNEAVGGRGSPSPGREGACVDTKVRACGCVQGRGRLTVTPEKPGVGRGGPATGRPPPRPVDPNLDDEVTLARYISGRGGLFFFARFFKHFISAL